MVRPVAELFGNLGTLVSSEHGSKRLVKTRHSLRSPRNDARALRRGGGELLCVEGLGDEGRVERFDVGLGSGRIKRLLCVFRGIEVRAKLVDLVARQPDLL